MALPPPSPSPAGELHPTFSGTLHGLPPLPDVPGPPSFQPRTTVIPLDNDVGDPVALFIKPKHTPDSRKYFEAAQPVQPSPLATTFPHRWIRVPQRDYDHGRKQWSFKQLKSVSFSVRGRLGINLGDALRKTFEGLDSRDDPVLQDASGAISCRFMVGLSSVGHKIARVDLIHPQFPGYPANSGPCQVWLLHLLYFRVLTVRGKINILDWTRKRLPITRSKLAHEVARKLERYLDYMAVRSYRDRFNVGVAHQHNIEIHSGWIC